MTFAGAVCFSRNPDFDLQRALASEYGGASDRIRSWRAPGVDFGWGRWAQAASEDGSALVADVRIDNRSDLEPTLGEDLSSDAALLLRAWQRWGEDFLDRVHGDIACALWDAPRRRLILGRDAMGCRPLHFFHGQGRWLFSATPAGLLTDPTVPRELDERFLAEAIMQLPHDPSASHYRGIARVPPGHLAIIDEGGLRFHRYWRPENIAPLRLSGPPAYAEAVRTALETAVECRIPASGPVGCELSAGLDSTAVTALAARQLAGQGRRLVAFTAVPSDPVDAGRYPGRIVDEGPLAAALAAQYPNIDHVRVPSRGRGGLFAMTDRHSLATREMERPSPNGLWADAIAENAARRGIKVLLEGGAGNITASYDGLHLLPGLARQGRLVALLRAWRGLRRWDGAAWPWTRLAFRSFSPLLPVATVGRVRKALGRPYADPLRLYAVNADFARATGVSERLAARSAGDPCGGSQAWRLSMIGDMGHVAAARLLYGLEVRDPMADRRLFELCLSIPDEQFLHCGEPRSLMRRAMAGLVPEEILTERRSGVQSADWPERFRDEQAAFASEMTRLEASPLAGRVLDLPRLRRLIDAWPASTAEWHGRAARDGILVTLSQAFGAGRFLRQFETGNE